MKATREQLEAENRRLSIENTTLSKALQAVLNHETEFPVAFFAKEIVPDEPGRYHFRFFDHDSPTGEHVIVTYKLNGQRDYSVVYDVDQQRDWASRNPQAAWSRIFFHALGQRKRKAA